MHPQALDDTFQRAKTLYREQKYGDALKMADQLAEQLHGGPALLLLRAQLYAATGRPTEAVAEFNRVLRGWRRSVASARN